MCDYLFLFFFKLPFEGKTLGRKRIQACQWRIIQVQKMWRFMILMLSETGLQADKNGYLKQKRTFLFVQPHPPRWQMSQNKKTHIKGFLKRKIHFLYTECPANVCDRKKKKHPSTQPNARPRSFIPIQLKAL